MTPVKSDIETRLLSVREAADYCGIHYETARTLINQGKFPTADKPVTILQVGSRIKIPLYQLALVTGNLPESEAHTATTTEKEQP